MTTAGLARAALVVFCTAERLKQNYAILSKNMQVGFRGLASASSRFKVLRLGGYGGIRDIQASVPPPPSVSHPAVPRTWLAVTAT